MNTGGKIGTTTFMEHLDYLLKCLASVTFVEMWDADWCVSGAWTFIMKDYVTSQKMFECKCAMICDRGEQVVASFCATDNPAQDRPVTAKWTE